MWLHETQQCSALTLTNMTENILYMGTWEECYNLLTCFMTDISSLYVYRVITGFGTESLSSLPYVKTKVQFGEVVKIYTLAFALSSDITCFLFFFYKCLNIYVWRCKYLSDCLYWELNQYWWLLNSATCKYRKTKNYLYCRSKVSWNKMEDPE